MNVVSFLDNQKYYDYYIEFKKIGETFGRHNFRNYDVDTNSLDPKDNVIAEKGSPQETKQPRVTRKKPKFVVKPIKRCSKSTGDLQSLTRIVESDEHHGDDDLILGDTDAQLYYNQKAQGKLGRKNGRKIRPDEAKRKQISMAKKDDQRQRQQAARKS